MDGAGIIFGLPLLLGALVLLGCGLGVNAEIRRDVMLPGCGATDAAICAGLVAPSFDPIIVHRRSLRSALGAAHPAFGGLAFGTGDGEVAGDAHFRVFHAITASQKAIATRARAWVIWMRVERSCMGGYSLVKIARKMAKVIAAIHPAVTQG